METSTKPVNFKVVFTADDSWWQARQEDFELIEDWHDDEAFAFAVANLEITENDEAFAVEIKNVDEEHTAIRKGDVIVSNGCGDDKVFLRRV